MLAGAIISSSLMTIIAYLMVQELCNYENIWGTMLFLGAFITLILAIVSIGCIAFI